MTWRRWVKPIVMLLYCIIICISLPFIIKEYNDNKASRKKEAWLIGGIFIIGAVPISLWTIMEHVINYTKPFLQRHIIRILWMVPIYALNAWFSIGFRAQSIYFGTLRECYEAYVIYNFMAFLLGFLKHEYPDFGYLMEQKSQVKHLAPCCCLPKWMMGLNFVNTCRRGVLQFTIVRPLTTIVAFICEMAGVYHHNEFRVDGAYIYLTIINNISQAWAMYSLIMFYRCMRLELKPLKPISKFICVKFVVFLSFWQSVLFFILSASGVITRVEAWKLYNPADISFIFQNFFICIEMFLAAIAHHFSFSVAPYRPTGSDETPTCGYSCLAMCDISDVKKDLMEHMKHASSVVKSMLTSSESGKPIKIKEYKEDTPLMERDHIKCAVLHYSDRLDRLSHREGEDTILQLELMENVKSCPLLKEGLSTTKCANDTSCGLQPIPINNLVPNHSSTKTILPVNEQFDESFENRVNFSSFNQSDVIPIIENNNNIKNLTNINV